MTAIHENQPTGVADAQALAWLRRMFATGQAAGIRVGADLSQGEAARAAGVSPAAVCRWEAGDRRPSGEPALRYARLLRALTS